MGGHSDQLKTELMKQWVDVWVGYYKLWEYQKNLCDYHDIFLPLFFLITTFVPEISYYKFD